MSNLIIAGNTVIELNNEQMNTVLKVTQSLFATTVTTTSNVTSRTNPTQVEPKVYEHVSEGFDNFVFVVKDNKVVITHKDGSYLHEKAPRQALNARLKANGATYDKDAKAWVFTTKGGKRDIKGAKDFVANNSNVVTADEINAIHDKWTEKSAKRANKATK